MKKIDAIKLLTKELNFEEEIMYELTNTFLNQLKNIKELSKEEIKESLERLTILRNETEHHKKIFRKLITYLKENDSDNY